MIKTKRKQKRGKIKNKKEKIIPRVLDPMGKEVNHFKFFAHYRQTYQTIDIIQ